MLNSNVNKVATNTQQPKRVGNQEFGGYSSWIEYAQNDPKGAEKPYNSIKWENDKVGIKLNNNMNRVYSQVDFQWCDESNQYIEVSSVSSDYAGDFALCAAVTNQTDTDVGYAAGITTAAAIVQFNKANVTFPLITKGYAATGTTSVSFPEYSKLGVSDVTNNAAGSEGDHQNAVA